MKKVFNKLLITLFCVATATTLFSQELRCRVNVQYNQIADADKDFFNTFQKAVEEFMNSQTWTNASFEENEKIEMKVTIRVTQKLSNKNYIASLQIQSTRPCYNSTYNSTLLNHVDETMTFEYEENQALEFSENSYLSNLTSTLAFYAYLVIGLDFDTFSNQGGTPYFQKAQQIVTTAGAQNSSSEWSNKDKTSRYWLIENILNTTYAPYRNALYTYHRLGLDIMSEKPLEGRKEIIKAIEDLQKVHRIKPSSLILTVFFYAKKDELINIFSEAQPDEKQRVVTLLKIMNPANASDYDKILAN